MSQQITTKTKAQLGAELRQLFDQVEAFLDANADDLQSHGFAVLWTCLLPNEDEDEGYDLSAYFFGLSSLIATAITASLASRQQIALRVLGELLPCLPKPTLARLAATAIVEQDHEDEGGVS